MRVKQRYVPRVDYREFLNYPGFHGGAYIYAYVEDTTDKEPHGLDGEDDDAWVRNYDPRFILEMADCSERIRIEFDVSSAHQRQNSFHKIDTLIEGLQRFREGMVEECRLYRDRQKLVDDWHERRDEKSNKTPGIRL